nr:uncharacterized protein LOC117845485 isoform X2 [Setaria viridis]
MAEAAQLMFNLQRRHPPAATPRPLMDIFRKASSIVEATGDEAWFDYSGNLDQPSKEVDDELRKMTMRLEVAGQDTPGQAVDALLGDPGRVTQVPAGGDEVQRPPEPHDNDRTTDEHPVPLPLEHQAASAFGVLFTRPEPPLHCAPTPRQEPAPLAQPESPKRRRPRRVFDMSTPVEAALQEYLAMFQGPLPPEVIAALTAAFNLDDEQAEALDAAMAMVAGEAIQDIQETVEALQAEGPLAAV